MSPSPTKGGSRVLSENVEFLRPNLPSKCKWHLGSKQEDSVHHHQTLKKKPKLYPNVLHAIGDTPLIRLNKIPLEFHIKCEVLAKCEFFNAGGSVKDRIALRMVEEAEKKGKLKPGSVIIEPTSGNTGIGLALAAAVKGYRIIIVMPEKMSQEKADVLKALGAEIVRTPTSARFDSPDSHVSVAQRLCAEIPNSVLLHQYRNPGNPLAHYDTTAEEILEQCDGKIDMIVLGAGTGGTITGVGRKIKERCPNCKVIAVIPSGSVYSVFVDPEVTSECGGAFYEVEGLGSDFIPTVLDSSVVDKWIKTDDKETFQMARMLIKKEGLLCGGSSGGAMAGAVKVAQELTESQRCVVLLPDGVRNYMTKFLTDSWMAERDFMAIHSEMTAKYWWWNRKVSCLNLESPVIILPHSSCQDAIDVMNRNRCNQLAVVDNVGAVIGVVKLGNLMRKIMSGKVMNSTLVSEALSSTFHKITSETTLGKLSGILDQGHFALVVQDQKEHLTGGETTATKQTLNGVVTRMDLIKYVSKWEQQEAAISDSPVPASKNAH